MVFLGEKAEVKLGSDLPPERARLVTLEADRPSGSDFFIFFPYALILAHLFLFGHKIVSPYYVLPSPLASG